MTLVVLPLMHHLLFIPKVFIHVLIQSSVIWVVGSPSLEYLHISIYLLYQLLKLTLTI